MRERSQSARAGLAVLALVVLVPAAALAGKTVVSGQQSLQLKVSVSPTKAGARGATLHFHETDLSTKPGGQQPPYNTKDIIFRMPAGLTLRSSALPRCPESMVIAPKATVAVCPAGSNIGVGTATVNARPSIPQLITGTITVYNGVDDGNFGGHGKGNPELILDVKTSIGVRVTDFFHVVKTGKGNLELIGTSTKPAKPGVAPGDITIQKLDLTISGSGKRAYIVNPKTCTGSWPFSLTITNFFGQPSVTAPDRVKCNS